MASVGEATDRHAFEEQSRQEVGQLTSLLRTDAALADLRESLSMRGLPVSQTL